MSPSTRRAWIEIKQQPSKISGSIIVAHQPVGVEIKYDS